MDINYKDITRDIYASQGLNSSENLNCSQISDGQFEELGDAVMELIHPGEAHEYMDRMMGGEGSESLRQAHINMGRSYLGCWSGYNSGPFMPMGGWMMGGEGFYGRGGGYGMMTQVPGNWNYGYGIGPMIYGAVWWVLVIIGVVALIKWIINISNKPK